MTDRHTGSQDYSLEEILADVRTSRQTPDKAEKEAPAAAPDSAAGDGAPEEPPKEEKPAARKVPLWPEKEEQPARHPLAPEPDEEDDEFITAETLAGLEEEDERPRRVFSLFSRGKKEKSPKEKPEKPEKKRARREEPEEEQPYYGLRLKTREEYKRDYEQTMAFDSVAKGDGESPYSYLFHDEGGTPDDGMDERMRKMRQERAARVAKVMRQAGLDEEYLPLIAGETKDEIAASGELIRKLVEAVRTGTEAEVKKTLARTGAPGQGDEVTEMDPVDFYAGLVKERSNG